jgi:hypothetical protein
MSINCTYGDLSTAGPGLQKLAAVRRESGASHVDLARIARFVQAAYRELSAYQQIQGGVLRECSRPIATKCQKCGEVVEGAAENRFQILPDKIRVYAEEMKKLHEISTEIPGQPLPLALHRLADLSAGELAGLGPLIEWPAEDEPTAPAEPSTIDIPAKPR